ncbi:YggT family protein [Chitinimonas taiwanensis]|uniref:YggT family protein n=1 Tax=Chitinimonas taiwanensis DSM 18899 TaxID=1121279 RepID=A0A1K2HCE5_9NEIS|nr:YggT family protein [Chitinimonas taiwanensis]SFZ74217.1 YggT family protein [Chitinimonas taiwanensis DSM 18899]
MFSEALSFLVRNIASFFILMVLLRFYLQLARAPFGHPLAQFTVKLTNFAVLPLRRMVGSLGGYDTATVLLAWFCALLMHLLLLLLLPLPINWLAPDTAFGLFMLAVLELLRLSLYLVFGAVLVQAILSWVNPYNPLAPILDALSRPFLKPIRRLLPPVGGFDLSPLVLLLLLQMLLMFVLAPIEQRLLHYILLASS